MFPCRVLLWILRLCGIAIALCLVILFLLVVLLLTRCYWNVLATWQDRRHPDRSNYGKTNLLKRPEKDLRARQQTFWNRWWTQGVRLAGTIQLSWSLNFLASCVTRNSFAPTGLVPRCTGLRTHPCSLTTLPTPRIVIIVIHPHIWILRSCISSEAT
jgi:hypothetical protein